MYYTVFVPRTREFDYLRNREKIRNSCQLGSMLNSNHNTNPLVLMYYIYILIKKAIE
jgi:hypothetical protein